MDQSGIHSSQAFGEECNCQSSIKKNFRETLPCNFTDQILYQYTLCIYGNQGEELLDRISPATDLNVRKALDAFFLELDHLSLDGINELPEPDILF